MLVDSNPSQSPFTEEEKAAATEQLERLLANPYFSHSRRFPSFLRFIVGHTLAGQTDLLKERTLGVEIFGKPANYDTGSDPIVRVTAAEIRKRIAQYYQVPEHQNELRLSLPPGSYVPQFHPPHPYQARPPEPRVQVADLPTPEQRISARLESAVVPTPALAATPGASAQLAGPEKKWVRAGVPLTALVVVFLVGLGFWIWHSTTGSAVNAFWAPVLNSADPVLFCVADQTEYTGIELRDAADPTRQVVLKDTLTAVVIDDLTPTVKLAGLLQSNGKKFSLRGEGSTALMDLRAGPTVFIGAYDNAWTLRLQRSLRYHFWNDPDMTRFGIVDRNAANPTWMVDRRQQMATNNYRDYAIVARFTDSTTGRLAIIVAGIGRGGTIAAGEFLSDPTQLAPVLRSAGDHKNMEFVLSTPIIDGEPGPPRVEASYFW